MENKYKLQYLQTIDIWNSKTTKIILFSIWLIVVLFLIIVSIISPDNFLGMLLLIFAYSCMFGIIALSIFLSPKNNKDYEYLKNIGQKENSYIVDAGFSRHKYYKLFYFTLFYDEKLTNIYKLNDNDAYYLLKVILDSYSSHVEKSLKIPIEIYCYKNKLYADLDSVDLSKLPGYEEAKKVIENS